MDLDAHDHSGEGTAERSLRAATLLFVAGFLVHNADHARRGIDAVTDHVVWGGTTVAMVAAVVVTLVFTRHPMAPLAAAAGGLAIAIGVSASHLLPEWSALSDSLPEGSVDAWTWLAVLSEIGGALVMGLAGLAILRSDRTRLGRRQGVTRTPPPLDATRRASS